jgi:hypothetical protein
LITSQNDCSVRKRRKKQESAVVTSAAFREKLRADRKVVSKNRPIELKKNY